MRRTMLCGVTLLLALGVLSGCNSGTKITPEDENPNTETEPGPVVEDPNDNPDGIAPNYVWHHDATYHWKEDTNGVVSGEIDKEEHTLRYIDDLDPSTHLVRCAICGYEDDLAHDWVDLGTTREPTCTVVGLEAYECSICGATKTEEIPALGHLFDDVYESDWVAISNEYHARQCQREGCGEVVTEAHRDVTEVINPTCTTDGYTHHKCVICGHEYKSDTVAAYGHDFEYVSLDSEGGEIDLESLEGHHQVCKTCGCVDEDSVEPHEFTRVVTDIPTSEKAGTITYHCEECNFYFINEIPAGEYSFATDSWETIASISALGAADGVYSIGDERTITFNGGSYTARIIGFDHDELSENDSNYGSTEYNGFSNAAGITIELEECVATQAAASSSNDGGWDSSNLKTYLSGTAISNLDSELQGVLKTVSKVSNTGVGSTTVATTDEKLFSLALAEVYSEKGISNSSNDRIKNPAYTPVYLEEGTQYEYYQTLVGDTDPATGSTSTVKALGLTGAATEWWFRTAQPTGSSGWFYTSTTGVVGGTACNTGYGVSFAFCI